MRYLALIAALFTIPTVVCAERLSMREERELTGQAVIEVQKNESLVDWLQENGGWAQVQLYLQGSTRRMRRAAHADYRARLTVLGLLYESDDRRGLTDWLSSANAWFLGEQRAESELVIAGGGGEDGIAVIRASDCIGAVVNGVCHGRPSPGAEIDIETGRTPRCYGQMIAGRCTGPMF